MQTRKITRNWAIVGAVATMLAASTAAVHAQATGTPSSTAPNSNATVPDNSTPGTLPSGTATTTTPAAGDTSGTGSSGSDTSNSSASDSMSGSMSSGMPNYHILSNPHYDYVDLMQARARGLSDSQIATIAKIARKSGMSFRTVSAAVERGETFPMLATEYNLNLADVYESDKEKQQIADYISTYESIGTKSGSMMGSSMDTSMLMTPAPMASAPMASAPMTSSSTTPAPMTNTATMDIVDTAMAAKNLTTLVKALQVAGLVETLKGAGPFTVFAPTDNAFSKLPAGTLDSLMADPAKLKSVLSYHVIPASIDAATAMSMSSPTSPPTVEGSTLQVTKGRHGKLMINNATVTKANIQATNGIIHIIDRVLLPPMDASGNIVMPTTGTDTTTPVAPTTQATPAQ